MGYNELKTMKSIPTVREFMSTNLVTVQADMDIFVAITRLVDHKISGAPVVEEIDQRMRLVGILTEKDCMSVITNGAFYDLPAGRVADYMSQAVVTIKPEMDIFATADIFLRNPYRRIPVVESNSDFLMGIVSRGDVLYASRKLWQNQHAPDAPDPGYLTEDIKGKLGDTGLTHLHKKIN